MLRQAKASCILDLYSGKIVGWAMDSTMTSSLVCDALKQAIGRVRPPRGVICHSDRGVQYASKKYRALLKKHGFIQSMSRKGIVGIMLAWNRFLAL